MPDDQLAAKLDRPLSSVRDRRKQFHLPPFEPEGVLEKWLRWWFLCASIALAAVLA
jgi:hypothetical protein